MKSKAGLVLTGGGARAAYQVGALRALGEMFPQESTPFPILSGTSAGAINAVYLAARAERWAESTQGLYALWAQLDLEQIYRTDSLSLVYIAWGWIIRTLFGEKSNLNKPRSNFLLDTKPLRALLDREMNLGAIEKNFQQKSLIGLNVSAVHYSSGATISFFHTLCKTEPWLRSNRLGVRTHLTVDHVMASAAIPIFFPPIQIGSNFYGDGSLRQTTPLSPAIHMGADRILAISIRHEESRDEVTQDKERAPPHPPALAEIAGELMHSVFMDSLDADLERVKRINSGLSKIPKGLEENPLGELRPIPVLVLSPSRALEEMVPPLLAHFPANLRFLFRGLGVSHHQGNALLSYLAFLKDCIDPMMELGYRDTLARKEEIQKFMS